MGRKPQGQILIECPNTIFYLYVNDASDLSKIAIFTRNIRKMKEIVPEFKSRHSKYCALD